VAIKVTDLIVGALTEIRVARAGDVLEPEAQDLALSILNEYFDQLNADNEGLYSMGFPQFTLIPNHQPHTIGVAANAPDLVVPVGRPVEIRKANIILPNSIRSPLDIWDDERWLAELSYGVSGTISKGLNYSPDWPNGTMRLWPVPTVNYGIELWTSTLLANLAIGDTFDLPQGYQAAIRLTLAELCAPSFGAALLKVTQDKARDARNTAFQTNMRAPRLRTRDGGMPGGRSRNLFDYRTGRVGGRLGG
jgi:hypothetical protein